MEFFSIYRDVIFILLLTCLFLVGHNTDSVKIATFKSKRVLNLTLHFI